MNPCFSEGKFPTYFSAVRFSWRYFLNWNSLLSNDFSVGQVGIKLASLGPVDPQTLQTVSIVLRCPPEFESKALLLKTPHVFI